MTSDNTPNDEPSSAEEFEAALGRAILAALENGVDPRGSWEYRPDDASTDMEITVVELAD